ncbi:hypothetical protein CBL_04546 [Carabus blaptoides fortunei]
MSFTLAYRPVLHHLFVSVVPAVRRRRRRSRHTVTHRGAVLKLALFDGNKGALISLAWFHEFRVCVFDSVSVFTDFMGVELVCDGDGAMEMGTGTEGDGMKEVANS